MKPSIVVQKAAIGTSPYKDPESGHI
jgi:hypothetical protein